MTYLRLYFWWYLDQALLLPIVWTRRCIEPVERACCRRYLREFKRLKERGLLPLEEAVD